MNVMIHNKRSVRLQRKNRNRMEAARALRDFLAEGLVAQGLNLPAAAKELDVQIVFGGTVRISHPGSALCVLTDVRFGSKITANEGSSAQSKSSEYMLSCGREALVLVHFAHQDTSRGRHFESLFSSLCQL